MKKPTNKKEPVKLISTKLDTLSREDMIEILLILHQECFKYYIVVAFPEGLQVIGVMTKKSANDHLDVAGITGTEKEILNVDSDLLHLFIHRYQEESSLPEINLN